MCDPIGAHMPAILIQTGFLVNPFKKNRCSKRNLGNNLLKESARKYWPISKMPVRLKDGYVGI